MVGAGQPEDFLAVHARLAAKNVLDGIVENVAEREHAGDVRGWDDDGIRGLDGMLVRDEAFLVEPELIPFVLDGLRFVGFGDFRHAFRQN